MQAPSDPLGIKLRGSGNALHSLPVIFTLSTRGRMSTTQTSSLRLRGWEKEPESSPSCFLDSESRKRGGGILNCDVF